MLVYSPASPMPLRLPLPPPPPPLRPVYIPLLRPVYQLLPPVYPPEFYLVQGQPVWHHLFHTQQAAFPRSQVEVCQVWRTNLKDAFLNIDKLLSNSGGPIYISMDTEFPGTYYQLPEGVPYHMISPADFYSNMKQNVDALKLIQLGLTIWTRGRMFVYEFNFCDFDPDHDLHNQESISLLKKQGINFLTNKQDGIDSRDFARLFLKSRLASSSPHVAWVTFHGPYDFAYLIKILIGNLLPDNLKMFMEKVNEYFGNHVYDVKTMIPYVRLHGGLDRVARSMNLERSAGKSHQAGSDSLLTMDVFFCLMNWLRNCYEPRQMIRIMSNSNFKLYGLTT